MQSARLSGTSVLSLFSPSLLQAPRAGQHSVGMCQGVCQGVSWQHLHQPGVPGQVRASLSLLLLPTSLSRTQSGEYSAAGEQSRLGESHVCHCTGLCLSNLRLNQQVCALLKISFVRSGCAQTECKNGSGLAELLTYPLEREREILHP